LELAILHVWSASGIGVQNCESRTASSLIGGRGNKHTTLAAIRLKRRDRGAEQRDLCRSSGSGWVWGGERGDNSIQSHPWKLNKGVNLDRRGLLCIPKGFQSIQPRLNPENKGL
jgi:hypothetical protein